MLPLGSLFHQVLSSPTLLPLSAGCQQAPLPAHGHPPAPRVLAEAADGEPGVPQAPQQDVPAGFPRKSPCAEQAVVAQHLALCMQHPPCARPPVQVPLYRHTHTPQIPLCALPAIRSHVTHAHLPLCICTHSSFPRATPTRANPRAAVQIPGPVHSFTQLCAHLAPFEGEEVETSCSATNAGASAG